jgi:hypothetical protein
MAPAHFRPRTEIEDLAAGDRHRPIGQQGIGVRPTGDDPPTADKDFRVHDRTPFAGTGLSEQYRDN